jgi:hypothetical protein
MTYKISAKADNKVFARLKTLFLFSDLAIVLHC